MTKGKGERTRQSECVKEKEGGREGKKIERECVGLRIIITHVHIQATIFTTAWSWYNAFNFSTTRERLSGWTFRTSWRQIYYEQFCLFCSVHALMRHTVLFFKYVNCIFRPWLWLPSGVMCLQNKVDYSSSSMSTSLPNTRRFLSFPLQSGHSDPITWWLKQTWKFSFFTLTQTQRRHPPSLPDADTVVHTHPEVSFCLKTHCNPMVRLDPDPTSP